MRTLIEIPKGTLRTSYGDNYKIGVSKHGLWVETQSDHGEMTSARLYHTLPRPEGIWSLRGRDTMGVLENLQKNGGKLTLDETSILLDGANIDLRVSQFSLAPEWLTDKYYELEFPDFIWKGAHQIQRAFPAPHGDLNVGLSNKYAFLYNNHFAIRMLRSEIQTTIPEGMSYSMKLAKEGTAAEIGNPIFTDGIWWCEEVPARGGAAGYREHLEFREGEDAIMEAVGVLNLFAPADALRRSRKERIVPWGDLPDLDSDCPLSARCAVGGASLRAHLLRAVTSTLAGKGQEVLTYGTEEPVIFNAGDLQVMVVCQPY